jgi:uncharacterized protein YjiS (DUF1127 family)
MTQTLKNFFKKVINDYHQHKAIQQTMNELRKLNDRELNDIGISRGDIYSVASGDASFKRSTEVPANPNLKGFV